ncbi:MAG: triose-phosphate isomerase [Gammaproteobacteria bacterium]|nr:triose-phosphate isomerase [Gammaproteobacteria bacterium]
MRRPLVVGNWKMNGSLGSARSLAGAVCAGVADLPGVEVGLCPPFVLLPLVGELVKGTPVLLGAQDMSEYASGAYTGEVSGAMLAECGCHFVILGHSERRHIFGESDQRVASKFLAASNAGLVPILCVGETIEQRRAGQTEAVVLAQLDAVLASAGDDALSRCVVAYEPVWAIGTGETATPEQAQEVHALIRQRLTARDVLLGGQTRVLYGGSVKPGNAAELMAMPDVDGGLIGGASLVAEDFLHICEAAFTPAGEP